MCVSVCCVSEFLIILLHREKKQTMATPKYAGPITIYCMYCVLVCVLCVCAALYCVCVCFCVWFFVCVVWFACLCVRARWSERENEREVSE